MTYYSFSQVILHPHSGITLNSIEADRCSNLSNHLKIKKDIACLEFKISASSGHSSIHLHNCHFPSWLCTWKNVSCSQLVSGDASIFLPSSLTSSPVPPGCERGVWVTQPGSWMETKVTKPQGVGGSRTRRSTGREKCQGGTFTIFVCRAHSLHPDLHVINSPRVLGPRKELTNLLLSLSSGTYQLTWLWQTNWPFWFSFYFSI